MVNAFPIVPIKNNKTSIVAVNKSIGVNGSIFNSLNPAGDVVELGWVVVVVVESDVSIIAATVEFKVSLKFVTVDNVVARTDVDGKIVVKLLMLIVGELVKTVDGIMS